VQQQEIDVRTRPQLSPSVTAQGNESETGAVGVGEEIEESEVDQRRASRRNRLGIAVRRSQRLEGERAQRCL
jgi:hypothetical protein